MTPRTPAARASSARETPPRERVFPPVYAPNFLETRGAAASTRRAFSRSLFRLTAERLLRASLSSHALARPKRPSRLKATLTLSPSPFSHSSVIPMNVGAVW